MALPELFERLHSDTLRQLDEEGWIVSAQDDQSLHLVSDEAGSPVHAFIRLIERDDEVEAQVELMVNMQRTQFQQCSAPAKNIANLLNVALEIASKFLGR